MRFDARKNIDDYYQKAITFKWIPLQNCFGKHCIAFGLDPYSPYLSPIENIWSILKENLNNGQPFSTKDELWREIEEVAENLYV